MKQVTPSQLAILLNQVAESGIDTYSFQRLLESDCFMDLLLDFKRTEIKTFSSLVMISRSMPLLDLIACGEYDAVHPKFTIENFPHDQTESETRELHVVAFGVEMRLEEVFTQLEKRELRPATLVELLSIGAEQPNLQRNHPILALGSYCRGLSSSPDYPVLEEIEGQRTLNLRWYNAENIFEAEDAFLAVGV